MEKLKENTISDVKIHCMKKSIMYVYVCVCKQEVNNENILQYPKVTDIIIVAIVGVPLISKRKQKLKKLHRNCFCWWIAMFLFLLRIM